MSATPTRSYLLSASGVLPYNGSFSANRRTDIPVWVSHCKSTHNLLYVQARKYFYRATASKSVRELYDAWCE